MVAYPSSGRRLPQAATPGGISHKKKSTCNRIAIGRTLRDTKSIQLNDYGADDDWTVVERMKTGR
jgi:hypothetical protein